MIWLQVLYIGKFLAFKTFCKIDAFKKPQMLSSVCAKPQVFKISSYILTPKVSQSMHIKVCILQLMVLFYSIR